MTNFENWEYCEATFHAGASYTVAGMRFNRNVPKRVTSLAVRRKLEGVKGFVLRDVSNDDLKPAAKAEAAPKVKTVKKKKTVKKVKPEGDE